MFYVVWLAKPILPKFIYYDAKVNVPVNLCIVNKRGRNDSTFVGGGGNVSVTFFVSLGLA